MKLFVMSKLIQVVYGVIDTLYHTILEKKNDDPSKSYTAKLLQGKQNSMLKKKLLKNQVNLLFAIKDNDTEEIIYEAADITSCFSCTCIKNISPDRVKQELV